jgi:outer membrane protein TolC
MLLETVEAAERSLVLAQIRYREGYTDFQRVLDAQRSALTQADRKLQTDGAYLSAVVAFYKALGGGWQPDQLEVLVSNANREAMLKRTDWSDVFSAPLDESLQPTP